MPKVINELYTVLVLDNDGNEQIYAMDTHSIYGEDGPMLMQAVTSDRETAERVVKYAETNFGAKQFKLVKFVR